MGTSTLSRITNGRTEKRLASAISGIVRIVGIVERASRWILTNSETTSTCREYRIQA